MTVAVVIGAGRIQKVRPELGVVEGVRAHAHKVAQVGQQAAEGNADQQQRFKFFLNAEVEQHKSDDNHHDVLPAALGGEEGGEAGLQPQLAKDTQYIHRCLLTR